MPRRIFQTLVGTFEKWEDAANACDRNDLDPRTCIEIIDVPPEVEGKSTWIDEYGDLRAWGLPM